MTSDTAKLETAVLQALDSLYKSHATDPNETQAADTFLRGFQLTPAAFVVCTSLLDRSLALNNPQTRNGTLSPDSVPLVFFAAQTLANKLRRTVANVDAIFWTQRIVTWLSNPIKLPKMVVTQLLLALVAALPRLPATQDLDTCVRPDASGASSQEIVAAVRAGYAQCTGQSVVGYALIHLAQLGVPPMVLAEFLLLLAEEVGNLTERSARQRMQNEVDAWAPVVMDKLLPQLMHEASALESSRCSDSVETQEIVLRALTSWFGYARVPSEVVVRNPLLHSLLSFFGRDELFDTAVDLAVEVVKSCSDDKDVVQWLAPRLLSLRGMFAAAAEAEDVDSCLGLCRIFTEMGESYLELLLQQHGAGNDHVALVDLLLDCMSYPDAHVADVTIPFWFRLLAELQRRAVPALVAQYKPRLERLAGLCMQKLQFREDFLTLPSDRQHEFRAFRQELGDILRDCCQLLGVEAVLQHCVSGLKLLLQTPAEARSWETVEAHLYCFRSIAREVETSTTHAQALDAPLTLIFQYLQHFAEHPAVCYTSCLVVSRYVKWLHANPTSLSTQVKFLNTCVTNSAGNTLFSEWKVARAAAAAVRALAMDCWLMLGGDIVAFYLHIEQHDVMAVEDQVLILEGVCAGVAGSGDMSRIFSVLDQIIKGIGQRLTALFASASAKDHVDVALNELLRIMSIYEYLEIRDLCGDKHPLVMLTEQLWPLFNQMLALYRGHDELVELVCRSYKRILRSCGEQIAPLLPQLVNNLLAFYQAEPKSSYLYTAGMVLKFFSHDRRHSNSAEMDTLFAHMLFTLIETTTPIFARLVDMEACPDVVEEFFFLMERAVQCVPQVLATPVPSPSGLSRQVNQPLMVSVFSCAISALGISHNDAIKAVLCFLEQLYLQSQSGNSGVKLISLCSCDSNESANSNKMLVDFLLRGVVLGAISPSRVDADYGSAAGVMMQLAKVDGPQLRQWIAEWFEQATAGTFATAAVNFLSPEEVLEFQSDLFNAASERAFRRTIRHFGKLCASRNTVFKASKRQ
uniref:Exportin-1/Importin-beta-like domain-containing protein n=1 Tax=Hyaloperonospora arabidopsidis (strain Emoy2) TaxID=559515 RepID=M4BQJ6_HYAAE